MPLISGEQWQRPADALDTLRVWAEDEATRAIDWYLRDKATKRAGSRLLRAAAIVLAVGGAIAPLLSAGQAATVTPWGYVLLAGAAGCAAFDHFFGLSASWMRDMATIRAVQGRLAAFRFDWAAATAEQALNLERLDAQHRMELIRRFAADVTDLVNAETGNWMTEFQTNSGRLRSQTERAWPAGLGAPAGDSP
jgi:hypothetical protein